MHAVTSRLSFHRYPASECVSRPTLDFLARRPSPAHASGVAGAVPLAFPATNMVLVGEKQ